MDNEIKWEMEELYFTSERDTQFATMNSLFRAGVRVWHCIGELGRCPNPIMLDNVPMRIVVGDFPFEIEDDMKIGEMKFNRTRCMQRSKSGDVAVYRDMIEITDTQIEVLLKGIAVLIIVAEPVPEAVGVGSLGGKTKPECVAMQVDKIRKPLSRNEIPYWLYVINEERFTTLWNNYLSQTPIRSKKRKGGEMTVRRCSMKSIDLIIPETRRDAYMQDFQTDRVGQYIKELL